MIKTCIIGSGLTALTRAWQLKLGGQDCDILEASDQFGGSIQSHRSGDYLAEEGPNTIQVNSSKVDNFLTSIPGYQDRVVAASNDSKKRFILRNGKPIGVPMGPLSAITTPLWSFSGKLRALKEPFIAPICPNIEESVADFARRRLGHDIYRYTINPLIGGIYAGEPERLSLRYAFPKLYALEQKYGGILRGSIAIMRADRKSNAPKVEKQIISFKNGLAELPQLLVAALGESVHSSVSIRSIQKIEAGWLVNWNGKTNIYDEVLLTTPAHALDKLPLDRSLQQALQPLLAIDYSSVSVLTVAFKCSDVAQPLDGFGVLVPECEGRKILGVLFPASLFTGRAPTGEVLLTVFVGGERQAELAVPDKDTLLKTVLPELNELFGTTGEPTFSYHRHWPRAIPQYNLGYGKVLAQMEAIEKKFVGLKLAGNYRDGISLTSCIEAAVSK
ncbi:MAG: protoporphyrinogen oxidase [Verrucomicrobiota bacterium]|nr:protoporphyrinogen oxidase [Verrucomicrobiota bacterium]